MRTDYHRVPDLDFRPACPICAVSMWLERASNRGKDTWRFECLGCGLSAPVVVRTNIGSERTTAVR